MAGEATLKRKLEATTSPESKKIKSTDQKTEVPEEAGNESAANDLVVTEKDGEKAAEKTGAAGEKKDTANDAAEETATKAPAEAPGSAKPFGGAAEKSGSTENKPVFGAASTFGKASIFEKMKNKTNVFDSESPDSEGKLGTPTSSFGSFATAGLFGSLFGANSKFGNAFQAALQKKLFLDDPEVAAEEEQSKSPSATPKATQQYKQVELTAQEVKTGEEDEKSVFLATAKLFELDFANIGEGWKERGLGPLHLNQLLADRTQIRVVMRSQGLLRVILNYKIAASTQLLKGLEASLSPGKFLRVNSVSADKKPIQYLIKFSNESVRNDFYDKVEELKRNEFREATAPLTDRDSDGEQTDDR